MPSSTGTLVFNDQKIQAPDIYATESLGIGISDPTSNLEVVGNALVTSNLEVGTANLFVDTTTGRIGVGTNDPTGPLDVVTSSDGNYIARFKNSSTGNDEDARIAIEASSANGESHILLQTTNETTTHKWNILAASGVTPDLVFKYDSSYNDGTDALLIHHGGHVSIPSQPAFYVRFSGSGPVGTSSWQVLKYDSVVFNRGNHYSTTTGIFTVPETGLYMFSYASIGNQSATIYRYELYKNGSSLNLQIRLDKKGHTTGYEYGSRTAIIDLAENDEIAIRFKPDNDTTRTYGYHYETFSGYFLG